jgi:hypothetical protein
MKTCSLTSVIICLTALLVSCNLVGPKSSSPGNNNTKVTTFSAALANTSGTNARSTGFTTQFVLTSSYAGFESLTAGDAAGAGCPNVQIQFWGAPVAGKTYTLYPTVELYQANQGAFLQYTEDYACHPDSATYKRWTSTAGTFTVDSYAGSGTELSVSFANVTLTKSDFAYSQATNNASGTPTVSGSGTIESFTP